MMNLLLRSVWALICNDSDGRLSSVATCSAVAFCKSLPLIASIWSPILRSVFAHGLSDDMLAMKTPVWLPPIRRIPTSWVLLCVYILRGLSVRDSSLLLLKTDQNVSIFKIYGLPFNKKTGKILQGGASEGEEYSVVLLHVLRFI